MDNAEKDLSSVGPLFHLSVDDFEKEVLPTLTDRDTLIFPFILDESITGYTAPSQDHRFFTLAKKSRDEHHSKTAVVFIGQFKEVEVPKDTFDAVVSVHLPVTCHISGRSLLSEFAAKLVFNAITTSACIQNGRVFGNTMINLGVRFVFN
jgi:hypothetical protein